MILSYAAESDADAARRGQGPSESWPPFDPREWPTPDLQCPPCEDGPLPDGEDAREYLPAGALFLRANARRTR